MDGVYFQSDRDFLIWKCLIFPEKYILDGNNDSWADEGQNVLETVRMNVSTKRRKIDEES